MVVEDGRILFFLGGRTLVLPPPNPLPPQPICLYVAGDEIVGGGGTMAMGEVFFMIVSGGIISSLGGEQ